MRYHYTRDNLTEAAKHSICYSDILRYLKIPISTYNMESLKRHISDFKISISHFDYKLTQTRNNKRVRTFEEIFCEHSTYDRSALSKAAKRFGLYTGQCALCGIGETWNALPLRLELDHINGTPTDNRVDNLRYVCPNCHSQTPTFKVGTRGRN